VVKHRLRRAFIAAGFLTAVAIAMLASPFASDSPDGMERVAIDHNFAHPEKRSPMESLSPLDNYVVRGVGSDRLSTGLSGLLGVSATFVLGVGTCKALRARRRRSSRSSAV
jgi:hypothetical protein